MVQPAEEWRSAFEAVPAPLLVFAPKGVVAANDAACAELGRDRSELLGAGFVEALRDTSRRELDRALAEDEDPDEPVRRLTVQRPSAEGRDDFFELRLQALPEGGTSVLVCDVTEKHRLDTAIAALANANVAVDPEGSMVWRPFGNAARFGIADDAALGARVLEWIHPDELPHMLEVFTRLLEQPGDKLTELIRMRHPYIEDGWIVTRITGVNRLDDPGIGAIVVRTEDATPVDLIDDITRTTGHYRSLGEATPVGIIVTDRSGSVLYRNELARDLLGIDHEVIGRSDWLASVRSESIEDLDRMLRSAREDLTRGTVLVALERSGGGITWLRVDAVPQVDEEGRSFGLVATLLDVTSETETRQQLADAQNRLWHLATHDPLTNLANRVLFLDRAEQALARRARGQQSVALLYCDLDGFKPVNDRHGHAAGDEVLRVVAARLAKQVRSADVLCRFGGDEFLILCEGLAGPDEVTALVDRLVATVEEPIDVVGESVHIGMTVGVAYADDDTEVDDLVTRADASMYERKAEGRRTRH